MLSDKAKTRLDLFLSFMVIFLVIAAVGFASALSEVHYTRGDHNPMRRFVADHFIYLFPLVLLDGKGPLWLGVIYLILNASIYSIGLTALFARRVMALTRYKPFKILDNLLLTVLAAVLVGLLVFFARRIFAE